MAMISSNPPTLFNTFSPNAISRACPNFHGYHLSLASETPHLRSRIRVSSLGNGDSRNGNPRGREVAEEESGRVQCEVQVVSWRERGVRGWVEIEAHEETVWNVLTDYERLADFIPNLVCSERIPCPHPGRIWLMQRGMQRALYWHIEARVVLDLREFPDAANGKELHFSMVDGDFKKFEGKWSVKAGSRPSTAVLSYEVHVIPKYNFPTIFVERIIRSDLPKNLLAIACRAEMRTGLSPKEHINDKDIGDGSGATFADSDMKLSDALCETVATPPKDMKENFTDSSIIPLSASHSNQQNSGWGVYGKCCSLDRLCMVDEVHLRRCDDLLENGGVHRSVVASITVKAPVRNVWNVLTAYEILPEFVPNLAISRILSRENNVVRILQEGCKGLLYMVLHARVVLDLCEQHEHEITFEQVEGDFDSFKGKWLLEKLGNQHTLLKYIVESKMHKNSFLSEAIVEEVIYEDLPSNLCAIRDRVEVEEMAKSMRLESVVEQLKVGSSPTPSSSPLLVKESRGEGKASSRDAQTRSTPRPKVPGLQRDIEILKSELLKFISEYGQDGYMPMRKQLRLHGRVDLEKAVTRMGGFRKIASLMNLSLAYKHRKPKGYWDNLDNLKEELQATRSAPHANCQEIRPSLTLPSRFWPQNPHIQGRECSRNEVMLESDAKNPPPSPLLV
ncbi:uncharacterized protein LOC18436761 isoform X1 [Amborella trichopoda]|uniref:uncharacterized protein LOC18436761 isoform X1 n=1 Tax=Amborella trichopoda TaxID=13333 RepID=UPI0009C0CADE|nr:uncharacterized protein LOC18436761 isoform X1 [Amborella trichopoda]|eukprot:XP_020524503.1 uncharacterized protein LOC18436761 isoform X1 [Amborella trichopoda]